MPDPNLGCFGVKPGWKFDDPSDTEVMTFPLRQGFIITHRHQLTSRNTVLLLDKFPELQTKEQSLDALVKVDNGREVAFDGDSSGGAVNYFERCLGENDGGQMRYEEILDWYDSIGACVIDSRALPKKSLNKHRCIHENLKSPYHVAVINELIGQLPVRVDGCAEKSAAKNLPTSSMHHLTSS
jgi:hypothetical protein